MNRRYVAGAAVRSAWAVTAVGLYVVAPSVVTLLASGRGCATLRPDWFLLLILLMPSSWACLWVSSRLVVPGTPGACTIASAQLAGTCRVTPLPEVLRPAQ